MAPMQCLLVSRFPHVISLKSSRRSRLYDSGWTGILLVVVLLAAWEVSVSSGAVRSDSWPALSSVLTALIRGAISESWISIFGSTLYRMTFGFLLGTVLGIVVGLLFGVSSYVNRVLMPTLEIFRTTPIPAIVPPLIFLLGVDDELKITIIALAAFFPVALNTLAGVRQVDPIHLQVAQTFRVPRLKAVLRIQLPSTLPYVFAGARISLGISLIVAVVTEMLAGSEGVGYFIVSMEYAMRADDMYAAIILLSVLGYVLNRLFVLLEAKCIRWARVLHLRLT